MYVIPLVRITYVLFLDVLFVFVFFLFFFSVQIYQTNLTAKLKCTILIVPITPIISKRLVKEHKIIVPKLKLHRKAPSDILQLKLGNIHRQIRTTDSFLKSKAPFYTADKRIGSIVLLPNLFFFLSG